MKKIILPIILFTFTFTFSGCDSWLDLRPESEILLDDYWQTEDDVNAVLASCYRGLTEDDVMYRLITWGELRSDNLVVGNGIDTQKRYGLQQILEGNLSPSNAYCQWGAFYKVINYCNTLLKYAPGVVEKDENFTVADLHRVRSEALGLRALTYFYLVRAFRDIPLVLEASVSDDQNFNYPQQSEDVVIAQIISDLKESLMYIPATYGDQATTKGRLTRNAINSILADVYLWSNQYKLCINTCNAVLADNTLKLADAETAYSHLFYLKNAEESIFELQFNQGVQNNNAVMTLYGNSTLLGGELGFPKNLVYLFTTSETATGAFSPFNYNVSSSVTESKYDSRALNSYGILASASVLPFKYYAAVPIAYSANNIPVSLGAVTQKGTPNWVVYRLSDIILMKAEALAEIDSVSTLKAAVGLVNQTYLRSNYLRDSLQYDNYGTQGEVRKLVLRERQREFLFEGKRWFDLVRLARREGSTSTMNDYIDHKSNGNSKSLGAPTMDAMYMPISSSELKANNNLRQNPFYATTGSSSRE